MRLHLDKEPSKIKPANEIEITLSEDCPYNLAYVANTIIFISPDDKKSSLKLKSVQD